MSRTGTRWGAAAALGVLALSASAGRADAQQAACGKAEFEAVVESAAASMRDVNARNKPQFQERLRALKDKRGWSNEQFMTEAAVYVQDDKISELDARSSELLARLNSQGEAGSSAKAPDCKLLGDLKATMTSLVDTQREKWAYMFGKIDKALGQ